MTVVSSKLLQKLEAPGVAPENDRPKKYPSPTTCGPGADLKHTQPSDATPSATIQTESELNQENPDESS